MLWFDPFSTFTNYYPLATQLLDPATGTWAETGRMEQGRAGHTAVLLANGKVLVVGGWDQNGRDSTNAEIFDLAAGRWTPTSPPNRIHRGATALLQPDGKVRIPGGWDGFKPTDDELYDPVTGKWTVITNR